MRAWSDRDQALYELRETRAALDRFVILDKQYEEWQNDPNLFEARRELRFRKGKAAVAYRDLNLDERVIRHDRTDDGTFDRLEAGLANSLAEANAILDFVEARRAGGE